MLHEDHARVLLDRDRSRHRWENQPAVGCRLEELAREKILRTRQMAIEQRRPSAGTSMDARKTAPCTSRSERASGLPPTSL